MNENAPKPSAASPEQTRELIAQFQKDYAAARDEIAKVVVGHGNIIDGVLTCLFTGGNALLEGVPGLGKTLLIRTLAEALDLDFGRVQFTPDLMPADITGTEIVRETEGGGREFVFEKGPVFTQILLGDEINRATPKTQSALLEAMQEKRVTAAGHTHTLPEPFFVMATQNPLEQEGVYPLPEAQLDRFMLKLVVGYSSRTELAEILKRTTTGAKQAVNKVLDAKTILEHQKLVQRVAIADHVQDYAVRLVLATHPGGEFAPPNVTSFVRVGASPRAAQALVLGGKCRALVAGRPSVAIEDIKSIALPALRHRIALNFEGQAEGMTTDDIVRNIAQTLPVDAPMPAS
ncbi:yeaC [Symbiodinium necroappetens]|uniref:magnesium chelatase n=1 Tax=Symbiodinium necroappetens TaxID=1628268 RepID=A0A812ITJ2_9DINO|nr:yeaC [Symbiodinium necroappetens]